MNQPLEHICTESIVILEDDVVCGTRSAHNAFMGAHVKIECFLSSDTSVNNSSWYQIIALLFSAIARVKPCLIHILE